MNELLANVLCLGRPDVIVQPFHEGQVVGETPQKGHGGVRVRVDEARRDRVFGEIRERIGRGDAAWADLADMFTDDVVYVDPAWGRIEGVDELPFHRRALATPRHRWWRPIITVLASGLVYAVLMMLVINSFKTFDLIFTLTEGGPGTSTTMLSQYIYNESFISWNYGGASAAAMVLFLIVAAVTLLQFRVERKFNDFM